MANFYGKIRKILIVLAVAALLAVAIPASYINNQSSYNESRFITTTNEDGVCTYRLFNKFPIKKVKSDAVQRHAYLGGFPVGINVKIDGVLVERVDEINTPAGKASLRDHICVGDVILSLDGQKVFYAEDISKILEKSDRSKKCLPINILRGKSYLEFDISPLNEEFSGKLRLGLAVKDSIAGVGTVTFIKESGEFGALGHPICNQYTGECLPCHSGNIFDCKIIGVNKGARGNPGEIKAIIKDINNPIGEITANNKYGIYGKFFTVSDALKLYEISERENINPGKAYVFTNVNGTQDLYEIEIIKAMYQTSRNDKSMIIRVTDRRLIDITGGVIQGMSGSPIIQNDKIIGAVTHVFVNDPTKGYGIYLDWMYCNS